MGGTTPAPLGQQLRQLRGVVGLRELARRTGIDHSALSRYESGHRTPSSEQLAKILDSLAVESAERERLLALARRDGPGELVTGIPSIGRQLAQLIGYERAATRITEVAPLLIPGILQTRDYARAVLGEGPDTDLRVRLRVERAEILTRAEHPVELRVIVHVEALTRPVAPPEIVRMQLLHLLHMAELPNITVQVVPDHATGWMPSLAGPFIVIEFDGAPPLVHLEHFRASAFLWEDTDVRSFVAAAKEITHTAMTPARSTEVIAMIAGMEST
jgi:transcriptional regulator with XRE-family HTH domain